MSKKIYTQDYQIAVEELLKRTVTVQAESREQAIEKVEELYKVGAIILTADDYIDTNFNWSDSND